MGYINPYGIGLMSFIPYNIWKSWEFTVDPIPAVGDLVPVFVRWNAWWWLVSIRTSIWSWHLLLGAYGIHNAFWDMVVFLKIKKYRPGSSE